MYRLRWYCCAILNGGQFGDLRTIYQGCCALPFALAGLSCLHKFYRQKCSRTIHITRLTVQFFQSYSKLWRDAKCVILDSDGVELMPLNRWHQSSEGCNNNIPGNHLWCCHHDSRVIARVHPVQVMNVEQRQVAADLWTKPTDLSHRPACRLLGKHIHHCHLLLLSPKAHYSFYHPTEGRTLSWLTWLVTYAPDHDRSPVQVVTWHSVD